MQCKDGGAAGDIRCWPGRKRRPPDNEVVPRGRERRESSARKPHLPASPQPRRDAGHKGRDTGKAWPGVIDVSAALMTLVSLTGFTLIFFLNRDRFAARVLSSRSTAVIFAEILRGSAYNMFRGNTFAL